MRTSLIESGLECCFVATKSCNGPQYAVFRQQMCVTLGIIIRSMETYMKAVAPLFSFLLFAGCVTAPVVSDFNGASVKVVDYASGQTAENQAEATRVCRAGGKQRAEYASTSYNPNSYQSEHLFLCL